MAHETITATGQVCYRTKLMDLGIARSFARCIRANDTRFQNVLVNRSQRGDNGKFYVTFQPRRAEALDAMHARQQDARALRAVQQEFLFWQDPDAPHIYWCFSVASGETYQVTTGDCSCPDYQFRCQKAGIQCKHMIAWSVHTQKVPPAGILVDARAVRAAEISRMVSEDF